MPSQLFFGNGQTLVTRGNVAIYCYNALTAKTWDVTSSTDGKLTSSKDDTATILEKYFSDFVNKAGDMKLVENLEVKATPITNNTIGKQQIVLAEDTDETYYEKASTYADVAEFLNIEKPGKNKEEKTYKNTDGDIVAYVLESASTELASLQGKYVDVIFGKNNEVAYINVTADAANGLFVTAWDYDSTVAKDSEIELNGERYEILLGAKVSLYGSYVIPTAADGYNAVEAIEDILCHSTTFGVTKADRNFNRTVSASVVLDEDGKIKAIDFVASEHFAGLVPAVNMVETPVFVGMEEAVVEKISSTGKISTVKDISKISGKKLEDLEEADIRVVKNNELVSVEEIEVGNVLTLVLESADNNIDNAVIKTIFVSDATVTGTLEKVKNNVLTIDGEEYNRVNALRGNSDGDIKELGLVGNRLVADYLEEEVEVYLNFMGEVSAILSETESVPATIGIVTKVYRAEDDEEAGVEYLPVKILTAESGKEVKYSIYNAEEGEDLTAIDNLAEGAVVWFSADSDKVIEYNEDNATKSDILVVADKTLAAYVIADNACEVDGDKLSVVQAPYTSVNGKRQEVAKSTKTYIFDDAVTTYYNNYTDANGDEIEIISGWDALANDTSSILVATGTEGQEGYVPAVTSILVVNEENEVLFFVGMIPEDGYAATETEYAIVETINEGKEETYVTLVDNDTEYELATSTTASEGDFVCYTIKNDKITITKVLDAWDLANKKVESTITLPAVEGVVYRSENNEVKAKYEVDRVEGRRVYFVDYEGDKIASLYLVKDSVTVYDLDNGTIEVVAVEDLHDVIDARYAIGITADSANGEDVDTIVLF